MIDDRLASKLMVPRKRTYKRKIGDDVLLDFSEWGQARSERHVGFN
jgi:hypothetical protein